MNRLQTRDFGLSFFLIVGLSSYLAYPSLVAADDTILPPKPAPKLADLVRDVIIEISRDGYVDERHWNKSVKRFDGFRVRGFDISRKSKKVRHGFCRKFSCSLRNPEQTFELTIEEATSPTREGLTFYVKGKMQLDCEAVFAHYLYGVKGLNGETKARADVRFRMIFACNPITEFSLDRPIPRIQMNASIRDVDFWLDDLDLQKVGIIDGDAAEVLGKGLEEAVEAMLQSQESQVRKRIQRELDVIQGISTKKAEGGLNSSRNTAPL